MKRPVLSLGSSPVHSHNSLGQGTRTASGAFFVAGHRRWACFCAQGELGVSPGRELRASEAQASASALPSSLKGRALFSPLASLSTLPLPLLSCSPHRQHGQPGPVKSPAHGSLVSGDTCLAFCVAARVPFCSLTGLIHRLCSSQEKKSKPLFALRADNSPQQNLLEAEEGCFSEET